MEYNNAAFGNRAIIRNTAQYVSGKVFLLNCTTCKQVYRREPSLAVTVAANVTHICMSCSSLHFLLVPRVFLVEPVSPEMLYNSFMFFFISHN